MYYILEHSLPLIRNLAPTVPQSSGSHSDPDEVTIIEKPTQSSRLNSDQRLGGVQQPQSPRSSQMSQSRKRRRPVRVSLYDYEPTTSDISLMKQKRSRKSDPIGYRSTVSSLGPLVPQNRIENVTNCQTAPENKTSRTEKNGNSLEFLRKRKEEKQKHFEQRPDNQQIPQQHNQVSNKQQSDSSRQQNIIEQKQTKQQQNDEAVKKKAAQQGAIKKAVGADQIGKARNNKNINMKERSADHRKYHSTNEHCAIPNDVVDSFRIVPLSNLDGEKEHGRKYERNQEEEVRLQRPAKNEDVEAAVQQVELFFLPFKDANALV